MDLFMLSGYLLNKGQGDWTRPSRDTGSPANLVPAYFVVASWWKNSFSSVIFSVERVQLYSMSLMDWQLETTHVVFSSPVPLITCIFSLQSKKWFIQALAMYHLINNSTNGSASFLCLPHPTCKHKNVERTQGQEMWFLWSKLAFRICHLGGAKVLPRCLNPQKTHACKFHQPPNSG